MRTTKMVKVGKKVGFETRNFVKTRINITVKNYIQGSQSKLVSVKYEKMIINW